VHLGLPPHNLASLRGVRLVLSEQSQKILIMIKD
jgi:hypothetical protein